MVSRQPSGPYLVIILALGLALYGCWCLVVAIGGYEPCIGRTTGTKRLGSLTVACVYFVLCAQAVVVVKDRSGAAGAAGKPAPLVATILKWPAGPVLVGLVGFAIAAGGIGLAVWGLLHDHARDLDANRLPRGGVRAAQITGAAGEAARGLWVLLVAIYLITSAVTEDAAHAQGIGTALSPSPTSRPALTCSGLGQLGLPASPYSRSSRPCADEFR